MQQFQCVESRVESLPNPFFSLQRYKLRLLVWFSVLVAENSMAPLILYYGLQYGTRIKPRLSHLPFSSPKPIYSNLTILLVCTIITSVWGLIIYVEYAIRVWKLASNWSAYQPLTSSHILVPGMRIDRDDSVSNSLAGENRIDRWYLDASHWLFSITLAITLAELLIATAPKTPYIKLLAMVNPSMFFSIFLFVFLLDIASFMHIRAPFRISSVAKGELLRPGIYTILEDVIAVDLDRAATFRTSFNEHWKTSPMFRRRLYQLSILWSLPGLLVSGACTVVIFTTDTEVGSAVGWGAPFLWAILWAVLTVLVVGRWSKSQ